MVARAGMKQIGMGYARKMVSVIAKEFVDDFNMCSDDSQEESKFPAVSK
jgi:hypothetical protein